MQMHHFKTSFLGGIFFRFHVNLCHTLDTFHRIPVDSTVIWGFDLKIFFGNFLRFPILLPQGLRKVAESLFNSKIRYGLQMCGKIRWKDSDPTPKLMKDLQQSQNKMLRLLNGSRLSDKISTASLLVKFNMLFVSYSVRFSSH